MHFMDMQLDQYHIPLAYSIKWLMYTKPYEHLLYEAQQKHADRFSSTNFNEYTKLSSLLCLFLKFYSKVYVDLYKASS